MALARRLSPPVTLGAGEELKTIVTESQAAAILPPDVLSAWAGFGRALGQSLPASINRAAAHRRAFRQAIR